MEDWITQSDAANLRELSLQVINNWVKRGRVRSTEIYGKVLVSKADVLSYEPSKGGRPPKIKDDTNLEKQITKKTKTGRPPKVKGEK